MLNHTIKALLPILGMALLLSPAAWAGPKVEVCHVPPGNPANWHTIKVSENALSAHLAHGDIAGACDAACATLCDDGNACTIDDTGDCEQVGCPLSPAAVDCGDTNQCTLDSCDVIEGCLNEPQVNLSCDDGQVCSGPDICSAEGICGGAPVDNCCTDDIQCSQLFCDQESCNLSTNQCGGAPVQCSAEDLCQVSVCSNIDSDCVTTPVTCSSDKICDPMTGGCVAAATPCPCEAAWNNGTVAVPLADLPVGTPNCFAGDVGQLILTTQDGDARYELSYTQDPTPCITRNITTSPQGFDRNNLPLQPTSAELESCLALLEAKCP